ncbi:unnamed protein product [Spirodela intermedia]|uniref:Uncharacterized protein n=2 Tax=Spirodela intermedia TaxID=51605 RepID=A0A7I8KWU9_SPIIN|nr:unnamed protein product [Spirodela intermedia]CAA6665535.1 unnamed protein product [Spirodela intermedia]CAA7402269.1 unnamed protein product [Spirodela intermedia]
MKHRVQTILNKNTSLSDDTWGCITK